jgi:hypothetical protein
MRVARLILKDGIFFGHARIIRTNASLTPSSPRWSRAPGARSACSRQTEGTPPLPYPEPGGQSHLNTVRQVPEFRGLGRQYSWKEGWR